MYAVGAESTVTPEANIIVSPMGVIIRLKKIPTLNNNINAQVPVIKRLSLKDTPRVKKNISKESRVIERVIHDLYRKSHGDIVALVTTVNLISDSPQYTSILINENISNATERYFVWNILIDKSTGLMVSPKQALQYFGFSSVKIQHQINDWIQPC